MAYEMILYETVGPVATITLNRPQALNAINPQMTAELHAALDTAAADPAVRAIILTGAGRAFSAGYDSTTSAESSSKRCRPAGSGPSSTLATETSSPSPSVPSQNRRRAGACPPPASTLR